MNYRNSLYVVFASSLLILFVLVYQGTFAYFTANVVDDRQEGDGSTSLTTADLEDLTLVSGTNTGSNLWIPGEHKDFTFSITNPSSVDLCVKLVWKDVTNTWVNKSDLVYTLKDSKGTVITSETAFPSNNDEVIVNSFSVPHGTEPNNYTVTVTYNDSGSNQIGDMEASFSAKIVGQLTECSSLGGGS